MDVGPFAPLYEVLVFQEFTGAGIVSGGWRVVVTIDIEGIFKLTVLFGGIPSCFVASV